MLKWLMTTVEEIEKAVARLTPKQLAKFRAWFEAYQARLFDEQIERDAKAGKLDKFAKEAVRAHREGRTRAMRHFAAPSFGRRTKDCLTTLALSPTRASNY